MEAQNRRTNQQPTGSSSLPAVTLAALVLIIMALLYIGYEYITDNTGGVSELTSVALDTTGQQGANLMSESELIMVEDTSSSPIPVDLSQEESSAPTEQAVAPADNESDEEKPREEEKKAVDNGDEVAAAKKTEEKPREETPKEEKKSESSKVVMTTGSVVTKHTVNRGETFYGIANKYNMSVNTLKALNPNVSESDVKAGVTKLNVKVRAVHTVGPGDVLRVVADKYGISKEQLMRANGKTKDFAQRGEKLIIPYSSKQ